MKWYLQVLKKYAVFTGRASRAEFWWFVLFNIIVAIILRIIDRVAGTTTDAGVGIVGSIYSLAVLIPSIAVAVRRLHDTNKSGWFYLLVLTCVGVIVLIVFWAQEGTPGDNTYGPKPAELPQA